MVFKSAKETKEEQNQNLDFQHLLFSKIIPWIRKHLTNCKVHWKKVFWHMILHSFLCNALCKFSSKPKAINVFPKHILKSKAHDKVTQARKKMICHVILKNYLNNVLWKFLIKIESTWRLEIKEQLPQLALLCHVRTVRSRHWWYCIRKLFLKILQYPQETPVLGSILKNLQTPTQVF